MIFRRAAQREFFQNAVAVFVALFAILLTTQLIRLLGDAAGGSIAPESVAVLLGFNAVNYLPILLSLTVFVSVLLALSRAYRDSEMAVWLSSGVALTTWIGPVLRFALPLVGVIAAFSLVLTPWALNKSVEYRSRMDQRDDTARVSPGAFQESGNAERVFFVEGGSDKEGRVKNIFISSVQNGRLGVMAAASGHSETHANGDRFLVLDKGRRYEGTPGTTEYRVMEFDRYAVRTESREARGIEKTAKQLSTLELVQMGRADHLAELLWRIGIPLSALNLALLAIPLSFANPRGGRTNNLVFALLTYMVYSNLMSVSQAWVLQSKLSFAIGVWAVHVFMFVAMVLFFSRRVLVFSWGRLWR